MVVLGVAAADDDCDEVDGGGSGGGGNAGFLLAESGGCKFASSSTTNGFLNLTTSFLVTLPKEVLQSDDVVAGGGGGGGGGSGGGAGGRGDMLCGGDVDKSGGCWLIWDFFFGDAKRMTLVAAQLDGAECVTAYRCDVDATGIAAFGRSSAVGGGSGVSSTNNSFD